MVKNFVALACNKNLLACIENDVTEMFEFWPWKSVCEQICQVVIGVNLNRCHNLAISHLLNPALPQVNVLEP